MSCGPEGRNLSGRAYKESRQKTRGRYFDGKTVKKTRDGGGGYGTGKWGTSRIRRNRPTTKKKTLGRGGKITTSLNNWVWKKRKKKNCKKEKPKQHVQEAGDREVHNLSSGRGSEEILPHWATPQGDPHGEKDHTAWKASDGPSPKKKARSLPGGGRAQ